MNIQYCPACGAKTLAPKNEKHWHCSSCGFQYFHNVASAVAGLIVCGDELLVAERKFDPGKGLFDLPGGFVDYGETLEQAIARECQEELGVTELHWLYQFSFPNQYLYAEVLYHTQDAFFLTEVSLKPDVQANDDVAEVFWVKLDEIDISQFAFESMRNALQTFLRSYKNRKRDET